MSIDLSVLNHLGIGLYSNVPAVLYEPIVLARKPLSERSVAANLARWGTGALNINAGRIAHRSTADLQASERKNRHSRYADPGSNRDSYSGDFPPRRDYEGSQGRWPANIMLSHSLFCTDAGCADDCPVALLDAQSGESCSRRGKRRASVRPGAGYGMTHTGAEYDDAGGASRFFYTAKASRAERERGLADVSGGPRRS